MCPISLTYIRDVCDITHIHTWCMSLCVRYDSHTYVTQKHSWQNTFTCVTWLTYIWLSAVTCAPWLTDVCATLTHVHVSHGTFICVTSLTHMCVTCGAFTCATSRIRMCDVTPLRVCDMTHQCLTFKCVTWLIHMCDVTHLHVWRGTFTSEALLPYACVWHGTFTCVIRLMTHVRVRHEFHQQTHWTLQKRSTKETYKRDVRKWPMKVMNPSRTHSLTHSK